MEWYSKESVWDPLRAPNIGEASVDLRLGEASKSVAETQHKAKVSTPSSCSSPSKRKHEYYKSPEKVKCSVDGCSFDLRNCREYHRRHRVCQLHSKTSAVLVKGQEQRFCQQCSRFQSLDEFDGFKRSCRRRLEGHNKRRRKPRPRPPPLCLSADYRGPKLLQLGNPPADPYLSMGADVTRKTGAQPASYNRYPPILPKIGQQSLLGPFANMQHLQDRQFPMLELNGNEGGATGISMDNRPVSDITTAPLAVASGNNCQKMPSASALYLLSAVQAQSSSEISLVESSIDCPIQSQSPLEHVQFDDGAQKCSCPRSVNVMSETSGPRLALDASATNLRYNGMLQMGPELMENGGSSLTFPFSLA